MKIPKKHNPFSIPDRYFEEFSQHLKHRIKEEQPNIPKDAGFKTPKDYFDTLPTLISDTLNTNETKIKQLKPNKWYYMAAASVAVLALTISGLYWTNSKEVSWNDIVNTDIETYFDTNGMALTSYEISEVIPLNDLNAADFLETELQEAYILDYLSEETNDFETLNLDENE